MTAFARRVKHRRIGRDRVKLVQDGQAPLGELDFGEAADDPDSLWRRRFGHQKPLRLSQRRRQ
jgi:hypothetical protein